MTDERSTFEVTRARLEDIVGQVRRKDVSLEQSLDLLEEAVRLVNQCNELIDQTSFKAAAASEAAGAQADGVGAEAAPGETAGTATGEAAEEELDSPEEIVEVAQVYELVDADGDAVAVIETVEISATEGEAPDAPDVEDDERS